MNSPLILISAAVHFNITIIIVMQIIIINLQKTLSITNNVCGCPKLTKMKQSLYFEETNYCHPYHDYYYHFIILYIS